jgi:KaiC domain protein
MSEDDWFERAVRGADDADADADADAGAADAGDETTDDPERPDADTGDDGDSDPSAFEGRESGNAGPAEEGADADGDGSPFGESFASAFRNAPDPQGEVGGDEPEVGVGAGPEPGGDGAEAGVPGGPGGAPAESFDEDEFEFESDIERIDLGIEGLDDMILGGVPKRSLTAIIGSAGTGKTTFGLQFLNQALVNGQRGVYVTLEESTDRIYDTAAEKGWPFARYADEERLAIVHLDPVEMANSLASIRSDLPDLVEEFGADRLVLDPVSLLEMMYDHPSDRRSEVYQFTRSLKEAGVTTLVTSEASGDNPYSSRYGIIEYLADAVFVLQYVRPSDFQETRLAVEIQKIRDANHSRETKPYEITGGGLSVYRQANIF